MGGVESSDDLQKIFKCAGIVKLPNTCCIQNPLPSTIWVGTCEFTWHFWVGLYFIKKRGILAESRECHPSHPV